MFNFADAKRQKKIPDLRSWNPAPSDQHLNGHTLEWVAAVDPRYTNADASPWVGKIVVGHFDKSQPPQSQT